MARSLLTRRRLAALEDAVREAMPGTRDAGMLSAGALTERGVAAVVDSRGGDSVLSMRRGDGAVGATL